VHQQVSLVLTHGVCIGSLLLTIPLNPSPRAALLLADRGTLSRQLHTLQLLATHVPVGYGWQNIRLNPHLLDAFQQLNKRLFRSHHAVLGACLDRLDNRSPNADFLLDNNNQTHLDQILPPMKTLEITEKVQSTRNLVKLSLVDVVKHRYTNKLRTYLQYQQNMDSTEANSVLLKCARPRLEFYKHDGVHRRCRDLHHNS